MQARVLDSALSPRPSHLGKPLLYSIGAHVLLVVLVFAGGSLFNPPPIELDHKPIQARLVRKGTPRDEKLLPRLEQPPPPPKKVEAPPPAPTPEAPKPAPAKPAVAIEGVKPKETPRPQPGESEGDRRKKLFGAFDKLSKAQPEEELEGEADGDELGDAARAEGERYWGMLSAQVRRRYDVSQTLSDEERIRLRAQVLLKISRTGEVLEAKLAKPSGNAQFDNAVLLAVKKAQPFSPPPDHLRTSLQKQGVVLEFSP